MSGERSLHLGVSVHMSAFTPVTAHLHPEDNRVVLVIGDEAGSAWVDLYLRRPELAEFRDALSRVIVDLDAAVHALPDTQIDRRSRSCRLDGSAA